jgi:hypothetical protein
MEQPTDTSIGPRKGEYAVPDNPPAFCKSCGQPIIWTETGSGNLIPLSVVTIRTDPSGHRWAMTHFADCPHAREHRKKKGRKEKDMSQPQNAPYSLNEKASATACELLVILEQLALYGEAHPSCRLTIARDLFETELGKRVLARFNRATGLVLTIDTREVRE